MFCCFFFFFKQKTAYEMRISDWSSDVCSSDLSPELREICGLGGSGPLNASAVINLIHPADREAARAKILQALSAEDTGRYDAEFRIVRPDEIGRASCRERVCQYV